MSIQLIALDNSILHGCCEGDAVQTSFVPLCRWSGPSTNPCACLQESSDGGEAAVLADVVIRGAPQERQQAALVIMEGAAGNDPTVSRCERRTNPLF